MHSHKPSPTHKPKTKSKKSSTKNSPNLSSTSSNSTLKPSQTTNTSNRYALDSSSWEAQKEETASTGAAPTASRNQKDNYGTSSMNRPNPRNSNSSNYD